MNENERMDVSDGKPHPHIVPNSSTLLTPRWRPLWRNLRWGRSVHFHGASGTLQIVLGLAFCGSSLVGDFTLLEMPSLVALYCLVSSLLALSAMALSMRLQKRAMYAQAFLAAALAQLCLVWFAWRFRPHRLVESSAAVQMIDATAALGLLGTNAFMVWGACTGIRDEQGLGAAIAVCAGGFGLLCLSAYPFHLAIGGDKWLRCVVERYPMQLHGFSGYVYIPTTTVFSLILFAATLLIRRIITPFAFGTIGSLLIAAILVGNVVMQEIHIPIVSTQQLVLPCPEPPIGTWGSVVVRALDTSRLVQSLLSAAGISLEGQPVHNASLPIALDVPDFATRFLPLYASR